jgi:hypothetical protein
VGVGTPAVVDSSAVAEVSSTLSRNTLVESPVSSCTKLTNGILKNSLEVTILIVITISNALKTVSVISPKHYYFKVLIKIYQ